MPQRENAALTFPSAIFGALNASLAFLVFRRVGFSRVPALLVTIMYSASAAVWVFASFPDTYACSALLTTIFLWCYLDDQALQRWKRLSIVHAAACFVGPQLCLLGLIPVASIFKRPDPMRTRRVVYYGAGVFLCYVIPYLVGLAVIGRSQVVVGETRWASLQNFRGLHWYFSIPSTLVAFGLITPSRESVRAVLLLSGLEQQWSFWVILVSILTYGAAGLALGRRQLGDQLGSIRQELLVFLIAYILFFIWWQPREGFIYTAPVQLPLWLVLHIGWLRQQESGAWRSLVGAAAAIVIVSSLRLLWELRTPAASFFR